MTVTGARGNSSASSSTGMALRLPRCRWAITRPWEFGGGLVVPSATKCLGGHNDLLAGVVIGSEYLIAGLRETQGMIGAVCDPNTAYLLLRGLKTLELRVSRQNDTGLKAARFLE